MNNKILDLLKKQTEKINKSIYMNASSGINLVYNDYLKILGLINIPVEGYPGKRYYNGMEFFDQVENYSNELAKKVFGYNYINLHPVNGTNANLAAYFGLLNQGDLVLAPLLSTGGHLSHISPLSITSKFFKAVHYPMDYEKQDVDKDLIIELVKQHKPKMIIVGFSAWPYIPNFKFFREVCDEYNCIMLADIAHISGLAAAKMFETLADVVTSSSYKTFCCSKGGLIMTNNLDYHNKIKRALFPGIQGSTDAYQIFNKALALESFLKPEFTDLMYKIVDNAKSLAKGIAISGAKVLCGGTQTHLVMVETKIGKDIEIANLLETANVIVNANMVGIRLGTISNTVRGLNTEDHLQLGKAIGKVLIDESIDEELYNFFHNISTKQNKIGKER